MLIIFVFAPPRSKSSSSRCRAHHLHCAAALIIFFAPSQSSCFRPSIFIRSAARVTALPSLHLFGSDFRCRDAIPSSGRQRHRAAISSFVWPAHRSPRHNHFSGPVNHIAVPHSFQRSGESHRRTNINNNNNKNNTQRHHLFGRFLHSAGTSIAAPQSFQWAGESHRRAAIISAGRKIPSPRLILFCVPANPIAAPQSFHWASESHCRAAIFSTGRRIPSPRRNLSSGRRISSPRRNIFHGPANPIAAPQSFPRAGESHRRAAIFFTGRRIPSPRHNLFIGPANPIAAPQSFQRAGEFHRHATIILAGR